MTQISTIYTYITQNEEAQSAITPSNTVLSKYCNDMQIFIW